MNATNHHKRGLVIVMAVCLLFAGSGCDRTVAGELATITGGYIGNVVSAIATAYLKILVGAEGDGGDAGGAMHDHDH